MSEGTKRRTDLDFMRIMAIFAVVGIHTVAPIVSNVEPTTLSWSLANFIDTSLRWAVPLFVMISGALLIRPVDSVDFKSFYKKRAYRILIPLFAWPILYVIWFYTVYGNIPDMQVFIQSILSGKPLIGYHLYFLFLIAGLYVISPFISLLAMILNKRQFTITTIVLLILTTSWYHLEVYLPANKISLNMLTQGLPYVGYFMLGYLVKDLRLNSSSILFITTGLLIAIGTSLSFITKTYLDSLLLYGYTSIYVLLLSPLVFLSFKSIHAAIINTYPRSAEHIQRFSAHIFGIFLIHVMVLNSVILAMDLDRENIRNAPLLFTTTVIVSWLLVVVINKIPHVRALVS